ncbi:hypothetical protein [Candidatus Thioglobus sp.]|uniref:hypothetical protein n=1 Tax=Candidatus Thioglobus sp. TaxID=2026721 RepID=UPI003D0E7591
MKPKLHEYTSKEGDIGIIISCISDFDCSEFFNSHLGKSQSEQKKIVNNFQSAICNSLANNITNTSWQLEYSPSTEKRDSIDIFGSNNETQVVIELDKHRADQVAKKFVSRNALLIDKTVFYISLCYPGTSNMNSSECVKYFSYCKQLSKRMGNEYAGFIIE